MSACRPIIVTSAILVVVLVIASVMAKAQTSQADAQVILNLQNGQQYFGTPRVYQGDYNGRPTSQWPVYYEPSTASQYWGSPKIDQPVLALVSAERGVAGAMFWDGTYIGGPVKISIIGTFSSGWRHGLADGFVIYLFLKPTMWSVSPQYNYSVSYISAYRLWVINLYLGGDVIIPQSSTPYLIVQWNPFLRPGLVYSGQWSVVILSNIKGTNPSFVAGWEGIGTGSIHPNPGDRINITVTYDPSTNTLSGVATNLNTGQSASFTLNLGRYFTPPSSGNYVFGTGAATGWGYANWALLYVAMSTYTVNDQRSSPKPHISSSLTVQVFNVLGRPATTVPGVVFGVLYNSNFKEVAFMNSSGYLNFNNINPGTYTLEVYHYPNTGLNLTEYWGGMTVSLKPGNNFVTFYRHKPWIYDLQVSSSNKEIVITVTVNGTVTSPTKGKIELWVTNNSPSASPNRPSKVFDVTITPGLNMFSFAYPVSQAGTYYVYAAVLTHISTYTVTDQWNWTPVQVQTQLVKVTVQAIDGFGTVRHDWPVVIENVASGMGQVDAELVEGQQYVARVTGLGFTNTTTFVAKGPQMVIRVKIPTARIVAQAVDGFGNVRSEWSVQIDGVAAGQGAVGPIEVLSGRYTVRTWAFGKEFSRSVEVSTGQVAVIQVRVPTARLTIAVFDDAGRQIDDLVTAVELAGPLTLAFSSPPKNLEVLAGTYTIKITGPGWEGVAQVTLQEGERKNIPIVIHGGVATRERRPETTEKASTNTATPEGEFTWLVKISGDAFFWVFMIAVVGAIVIIVIRRRQ